MSFSVTPNGFNKQDYFNQLHMALVANGFNSALEIKEYSLSGKLGTWWNNSPSGTVSFNHRYGNMPSDAGGFSYLNQPNSIIIYPGLDGIYGQGNIETWYYVNATMHEIGHAFFGFDHTSPDGYGLGISGIAPSIMDYRYAYTNGQGFNKEEQRVIRSSIWGK